MVIFDYSKLIGKMIEIFGTQYEFAKAFGASERTISLKLNNKVSWRDQDIIKASEILGIENKSIPEYFFTPKVQTFEQKLAQEVI